VLRTGSLPLSGGVGRVRLGVDVLMGMELDDDTFHLLDAPA
jgi:hypothetical protein